jgi:hypothetical protein
MTRFCGREVWVSVLVCILVGALVRWCAPVDTLDAPGTNVRDACIDSGVGNVAGFDRGFWCVAEWGVGMTVCSARGFIPVECCF